MSVILTNGATSVIMRDSDFQVLQVPPWKTPSRVIENSVGLPRVHALSGGRETRLLTCLVDLELSDRAATAQGMTSLMNFFEGTDYTGVDGDINSFMLTDADGVSYQVRFADNLAGGLREGPKNQFSGTIQLINEYTLPTDEGSLQAWYAAWDMENNGGDNSNWTNTEAVGGAGNEWAAKLLAAGIDATQNTSVERPAYRTDSLAINNRPAINFDGTQSNLEVNGLEQFLDGQNAFEGEQFAFYAVVNADTFPASNVEEAFIGFGSGSGGVSDRLNIGVVGVGGGFDPSFQLYVDDGSSTATASAGQDDAVANTSYILSALVNAAGTNVDLWRNGTKIITNASFDVGTLDFARARIGCGINGTSEERFFDGRIGELVLFSGSHTDIQRRRQEYRLSDMWGIDLTG